VSSGGIVVVLVLFAVLAVGLAVAGFLAAKKRREGMAALAAQRGWAYAERDDRWTGAFDGAPFGTGHDRRATNVLTGQYDGRPFVSFDFVYHTTERSTDSQGRTTTREVAHRFGVTGLDMGAAFPALRVVPEGMVGRFFGRLTNRDIELESEDFNRAFTVTCPDRRFASDILHPQMMVLLLQHPEAAFRLDGRWILDVEDGTVPLEAIEPRLARVDAIVDQVPDFVWKEVRG
jgi:hypothetical protein